MNAGESPRTRDANEEVVELVETLYKAGQRLEQLTAGEVDSVLGRDGRAYLLQHAQDELRHSEAVKQAAILNALPAHIALLDTQGFIISGTRRGGDLPARMRSRIPNMGSASITLRHARVHGERPHLKLIRLLKAFVRCWVARQSTFRSNSSVIRRQTSAASC